MCAVSTANGFARAEAVCVVFLQKARDAKRIYAKIVHAKTNCDGYKEEGITFPSHLIQTKLMEQFYEECHINPASVDFVEAHATGTTVSLLILGRYKVRSMENRIFYRVFIANTKIIILLLFNIVPF
jgi:acyl transferase domain-containing protein